MNIVVEDDRPPLRHGGVSCYLCCRLRARTFESESRKLTKQ